MGRRLLNELRSRLEATPPGAALLIDDATAAFDRILYDRAVRLLNAACCQVIAVMHHLDPQDFKRARIFTCAWDQEGDCARIKLTQLGGNGSAP